MFGRPQATMRRNDCDLLVLRSGISSSEYRQFLLFSSNARATTSAVYAWHVYTIYGGRVPRKPYQWGVRARSVPNAAYVFL